MHFGDENRAQWDRRIAADARQASITGALAVGSGILYAFWPQPFLLAALILFSAAWVAAAVSHAVFESTRMMGDIYRASMATETLVKLARREINAGSGGNP